MAFAVEKGTLYVVPTPIGNLSDMTERALAVLKDVDFVAAEDTRVSGKLLNLFDIHADFVSYHEHNKASQGEKIVERLKNGQSGAIVTDAGTPAISDPGEDLVAKCRENRRGRCAASGCMRLCDGTFRFGLSLTPLLLRGLSADR